ncbi:MAG: hypothetical protein AAF674_02780 [Pseudomonadota bacterium]
MAHGYGTSALDFWNGYLHWAEHLLEKDRTRILPLVAAQLVWEPLFVTSKLPAKEFFEKIDNAGQHWFRYDKFEKSFHGDQDTVGAFIYRNTDREDSVPDWIQVLHVGAQVDLNDRSKFDEVDRAQKFEKSAHDHADVPKVIVGVIDDGIGFLNRRFRTEDNETRFDAIWLQALAKITDQGGTPSELGIDDNDPDDMEFVNAAGRPGRGGVALGKILSKRKINELIWESDKDGETQVYRRKNREIFGDGLQYSVEKSASHGTHILDLAAGTDGSELGGEFQSKVRLLGVQLPPQSVDDTSGVRLETHLLQGLRWMIFAAHRRYANPDNPMKLIVNISLGVHAGPKDGQKFLEKQIAREIRRARDFGIELVVVLPYGNDFETRLLANVKPKKDESIKLALQIQPDDTTPSFVEIRPIPTDGSDSSELIGSLKIGLRSPDGKYTSPLKVAPNAFETLHLSDSTNRATVRLYHVGERKYFDNAPPERPYYCIAFAPTRPVDSDELLVPPGRWAIEITKDGEVEFDVTVQVQRDDSAPGYRLAGRQAYLDDAHAYEWDREAWDYTEFGPNGPLTHKGTNSAYTTFPDNADPYVKIFTIGGALVREGPNANEPDIEPARYSSQGACWSGEHPDASAVSELSPAMPGVLAGGTETGTTARFYGTSTASATYTRYLAKAALGEDPDYIEFDDFSDRLGDQVVTTNSAIRG